jgi:hypothetical protein
MRNTIIIIVLSLLIFSCSKDNSASSPVLNFKSVNATVVPIGQTLQFTLSFTDTNGDLDSIIVAKIVPLCPVDNFRDTFLLPAFPSSKKLSGDIDVTYGNIIQSLPLVGSPTCSDTDTCIFRFIAHDASGHFSDSVQSPSIVILNK